MGSRNGDVVAILFTDVEGSTELLTREGDQVAGEILRVHEDIVRARILEAGGREWAFLGDGFLATFSTPLAALRCAVDVQRALDRHNREHPERQVRVRIGVHLGEMVERAGQLYGRAVNAAARVMGEAAGGEILVSAALREACRGSPEVAFVDRGLFWLKGLPERWRLYAVEWSDASHLAEAELHAGRSTTPLVGRDRERAELRPAVRSALEGRGGLVLVSGEAGVGKTRLTEEVAAEAEARGMRVLAGHCVEMEGGAPYAPFVEILEKALIGPRSAVALHEAMGDAGPEIARVVPGLRRLVPDLPPPLDLPPEQARRFLWSSVGEFLRRAAQDRPLLLVLEDLHWADESTLLFLEHLASLLDGMPVLVFGTYRDTDVEPGGPLARAISELTRRRLVRRVALGRLSGEGVAAMLRGLAGQEPPPGLVRAVHQETEGNPFFVEEVFLHLSESGRLLDASGRFRADLRIDELDVPESVRLAVGGRLGRLTAETRGMLAAAATSGRAFEPEVVGIAAGLDPDALARAFGEAERARLITPGGSDDPRPSFVHELIRQTLLAETSSLERQRLHARTADAIEQVHAGDVEDHAADLTHHLSRAGPGVDPGRLVRYLGIAGDRAVQAAAFEDAAGLFEHAASLASRDEATRARMLERLAVARRNAGRWEDALRTMDAALELYQRLGRADAIGRLCWAMVYQLAWAARFEEAVTLAGRGLAALGDLPNPDRARLLSVTGWVTGLAGDHETATGLFATARELTEELGERRALADVLHMATAHHMGYVEFEEGIETGLAAARVFEEEGALWELCGVLAFVEFQQGTVLRQAEASALSAKVLPVARRLGHLGAEFLVLADRVRRDGVMAGDLSLTEALAREEIEVCRRGSLPWLYTGHLYLGFAAHWDGRWEEAERELRRAVELEPPGAFVGQSRMHLALHLAEMGREEAVCALRDAVQPHLPAADRVNSLGAWNTLLGLTEALYLVGRRSEAAALHPLVAGALDLGEWVTFDCRFVRTRAGIAAAAAGLWDEAEGHFAAALELARSVGHRIEQADVLRFRARMLADRQAPGDADATTSLLEESAALYRAMGMDRKAGLVEGSIPDGGRRA